MAKILTNYDHPPIPYRGADWSAWVDGQEEEGPVGRGETRAEALLELGWMLFGNGEAEAALDVVQEILLEVDPDDPHD